MSHQLLVLYQEIDVLASIKTAIIEKCIFNYSSVNSTDNDMIMVSTPIF